MDRLFEVELRRRASELADAEKKLAEEYLLHIAAGQQTWQAQKMAEHRYLKDVLLARAEYEIALARLRRS